MPTTQPDSDLLSPDPFVEGRKLTPEETQNYLVEQIGKVRNFWLSQPGPPTDEITSIQYLFWERRLMITYGMALGALLFAHAFQALQLPAFEELKRDLKGAMLRFAADVQIGNR
jgi:hypothetical protein